LLTAVWLKQPSESFIRVSMATRHGGKGVSVSPEPQVVPLVYTVLQAAKVLTVCDKTIRRLVREGKLRHRKAGSRILIPRRAVEDFLSRK